MRALSLLVVVVVVVALGVLSASCPNPEPFTNDPRLGRPSGDDDAPDGCEVDADCNGGEVCDDASCVRVCDEDADCSGGQLCQRARCVVPDCIDDGDCPGGFFCDDNACRGIAGCDEGAVRCVDDDTAAVCVAGREVLDDCAAGFACALGDCVDAVAEGEGDVFVGEGEGDVGEGEGDVAVCEATTCVDDVTEVSCFFGVPLEQACSDAQYCVDGTGCVDDEAPVCVPECGARTCGTEPRCGTSCGSCGAGERCDAGDCVDVTGGGGGAVIEVAVSSSSFDVYLSRASSGPFCDLDDTCFFGNCDANSAFRPDWDGDPSSTEGDPSMTNGAARVLAPSSAQNYRVGVHAPRLSDGGTVTVNVAVDGVNVFGATKRLGAGELWSGITARWSGSAVTVSRNDVVTADFSCGGEACSDGGDECAPGFVCGFTVGFGGLPSTSGTCVDCLQSSRCPGGDECRSNRCVDDTTDRGLGGACVNDVDCRDDLACGAGSCGVACDAITCLLSPDSCNCVGGTTCGFDGVCN